ncbi:hypothetical protein NKH18_02510 [Streptomyces sp. M10(2022)]
MTALPVNRLTVLRAHRLTARRAMRLLQLHALTGIHLTLVCHRPHLPPPCTRPCGRPTTPSPPTSGSPPPLLRHAYHRTPPADKPAGPADRWLTLPALDRLVSYDSPALRCPMHAAPIAFRHRHHRASHRAHRPASRPPAARRPHPCLAAAVATALFTGASPATRHRPPRDYDDTAATLALHDRARYTDGCAAYPYHPGQAPSYGPRPASPARIRRDQELLTVPGDRGHLLRMAETARLRPPSRPRSAAKARSAV